MSYREEVDFDNIVMNWIFRYHSTYFSLSLSPSVPFVCVCVCPNQGDPTKMVQFLRRHRGRLCGVSNIIPSFGIGGGPRSSMKNKREGDNIHDTLLPSDLVIATITDTVVFK